MKTKLLLLVLLLSGTFGFAAEKKSILLTGASFAVPENGWFEIGCEVLGFTPVNKSVSGQSIKQTAMAMSNGTLYKKEQLDDIEAFVIMHVHNQNVAHEQWLKEDYNDYVLTDATPYAVAYDYVIRKYIDDCKSLKDEPTSKYYGSEEGKPAVIVLCTHWHDSRTIYNPAIRVLAEKWNLPLIEWDTNIGFTKDVPEDDGSQPSLKFAGDTETIDKVIYGWHPLRGKAQYIQKKMAEIYIAKMAEVLNVSIPLSATLKAKEIVVFEGEPAHVRFVFAGLSPWNLTYKINGTTQEEKDITANPLLLEIPYSTKETIQIEPLDVNNIQMASGEVSGLENIYFADDSIVAFFDTHVHEYYKDKAHADEKIIQLKTGDGWTRQAYFSFNLSKISSTDQKIVFRTYFAATNSYDNLTLQLEGNAETYTNKLNWNTRDSKPFSIIGTNDMYYPEVESYICWDITEFAKKQKESGASVITLRMSVLSGGSALCSFHSTESEELKFYSSILIAKEKRITGLKRTEGLASTITPTIFTNFILVKNKKDNQIIISSVAGQCFYQKSNIAQSEHMIDTASYPDGIYIIQCKSPAGEKVTSKLIKISK